MLREPNRWEKITSISSLALAVVALIALGFSWIQIREFRDEAKIQHLAEVVHEFDDGPINKLFGSLAKKRVDEAKEDLKPLDANDAPAEMYDIANFFEYVGLLTKRGYLDTDDVWDSFSYYLFNFYEDARPMIQAEQKKDPDTFSDLSWLVEKMRKIEDEKHSGRESHVDQNSTYEFYSGYIDTANANPPSRPARHKN